MSCGAETEANTLMTTLLDGVDFALPAVDLDAPEFQLPEAGSITDPITHLTNADLTSGTLEGTGTFDVLMKGLRAHLTNEYEKGRITAEQYAKAHIELTQGAMANSVQFLLGRDQAYFQAVVAQQQALAAQAAAITARVQLETAKVQLQALRYETLNNQAAYALTKLKLSTESIGYCIAKEQLEAARAQTLDTRSDGVTPVAGQIGKQKDLYSQQIVSYQRDSEVKVAKLFTDAWITMKTIDEGLLPPDGFTNASLDDILSVLKEVNNLEPAP